MGGGYGIYLQNSEFFKNSGKKGYICKHPLIGNVFVLTQAKMYLQYSEFLQKKKRKFYPIALYAKIENACWISQALKKYEIGEHLLQS